MKQKHVMHNDHIFVRIKGHTCLYKCMRNKFLRQDYAMQLGPDMIRIAVPGWLV